MICIFFSKITSIEKTFGEFDLLPLYSYGILELKFTINTVKKIIANEELRGSY